MQAFTNLMLSSLMPSPPPVKPSSSTTHTRTPSTMRLTLPQQPLYCAALTSPSTLILRPATYKDLSLCSAPMVKGCWGPQTTENCATAARSSCCASVGWAARLDSASWTHFKPSVMDATPVFHCMKSSSQSACRSISLDSLCCVVLDAQSMHSGQQQPGRMEARNASRKYRNDESLSPSRPGTPSRTSHRMWPAWPTR